MEETELAERMAAGDRDAFGLLMEKYQNQALRTAYLISGNYADSEDIVQETFVACWMNRRALRSPEAFRAWFYRTLSRNAWKICRKRKREQPSEEIYPDRPEETGTGEESETLKNVIRKEEEELLYAAVRSLPVKQRTMIVLYYFNQMSVREIAGACGCLEGTVKSRLFHAKARLKAMLERDREGGKTAWTILS